MSYGCGERGRAVEGRWVWWGCFSTDELYATTFSFKVEVHPKIRHFCKNSHTQGFISNLGNLSSSQVLKILGISERILDHLTKKQAKLRSLVSTSNRV